MYYYIVAQKWKKKYDIEIEIVKFVVNGSMKMTKNDRSASC